MSSLKRKFDYDKWMVRVAFTVLMAVVVAECVYYLTGHYR